MKKPQPQGLRHLFHFRPQPFNITLCIGTLCYVRDLMVNKALYHIFIYLGLFSHSDESCPGIVWAVILTHTQGSHNFCEPPGVFVIGNSHAALYSIRVVKEIYADEADCLVVVFLHKAFYTRVYRHDTVFPGIGFHSPGNVLLGKVDILNPEFSEFLRAPSHIALDQNSVYKAERIKVFSV